jgi:hypothetical protein
LPAANTWTAKYQAVLQGHRLVISVIACVVSKPSKPHAGSGAAMINSVLKGFPKQVLEIKTIKSLAKA